MSRLSSGTIKRSPLENSGDVPILQSVMSATNNNEKPHVKIDVIEEKMLFFLTIVLL